MKFFFLHTLLTLSITTQLSYAAGGNPYDRFLNIVPQNIQAINTVKVEFKNFQTSQTQTLYYQPTRMFWGEVPIGFIYEIMVKSRTLGNNGGFSIRDMIANDDIGTIYSITATNNNIRIIQHTLLKLVKDQRDGKHYLRTFD